MNQSVKFDKITLAFSPKKMWTKLINFDRQFSSTSKNNFLAINESKHLFLASLIIYLKHLIHNQNQNQCQPQIFLVKVSGSEKPQEQNWISVKPDLPEVPATKWEYLLIETLGEIHNSDELKLCQQRP